MFVTDEVTALKFFLTDEVTITRINTVQSLRSVQIVPIVETVLLLICFSLRRVCHDTMPGIRLPARPFLTPSARIQCARARARCLRLGGASGESGLRRQAIQAG